MTPSTPPLPSSRPNSGALSLADPRGAAFPLLLSSVALGPLALKNRMCMPAMHLNYTMGGEVSDQLVRFYAERARGGVALITVGGCSVDAVGGGPYLIGLHEDRFVPGLSRLAEAIHEGGALAVAQLYHAGRYAFSRITGRPSVSASAIRSKLTGETPHALLLTEILEIEVAFAAAASRAIRAGFDGVEVIASAGYLVSQFLAPATNHRDDEYGGPFENRVRFGREVVERVRTAIGPTHGVLVRVAGADFVPDGHTNRESAEASRVFARAGADAIDVTGGWHETRVPQLTMSVPRGAFLYLARGIREAAGVPIVASNRLGDPTLAEEALRDGLADAINLGRPLIADPELPKKIIEGRVGRVVRCVACNQGCLDRVFLAKPVSCMVNPRAGREATLGEAASEAASKSLRVLVVGGGPAGMTAATTAARRGHRVTLLERSADLGGQLRIAARARARPELATLLEDLELRLYEERVEVRLGVLATVDEIRSMTPDAVILATGARPIAPALEGADLPHVVQAWDVLAGTVRVGRDVVVVGGGAVAVDTALELATRGTLDAQTVRFLLVNEAEEPERLRELCRRGVHRVTIVEMQTKAGIGIGRSTRWTLLQDLERSGVEVLVDTRVRRIVEGGVEVVSTASGEPRVMRADSVVLAIGSVSERDLASALEGQPSVTVVGDARTPRRAFEAIEEAYLAAVAL